MAGAGESLHMGSDDVAEFVKEREAEGVFRLEVKLTGEVRYLPHAQAGGDLPASCLCPRRRSSRRKVHLAMHP
jgi:hypothetical protein